MIVEGLETKRDRRITPDDWVTTAVPELRILDDEVWNQVKARQLEMRRVASNGDPKQLNRARRPKYLFSGLTKCAESRWWVRDVLARPLSELRRAVARHVPPTPSSDTT